MTAQTALAPLVWVLNGFLVIVYLLVEHWQTLLLVPFLGFLMLRGPAEHHRWAFGIALLVMIVSLFAPQPVPILILAMAIAASIAISFERFNPASLHWRSLSGLALYALIGIGVSAFQAYVNSAAADTLMLSQGQVYIGIMGAIGLYGVPLGFLALLAQNVFVHPPIPGGSRPEQLINTLRARKQD